MAKLAARLVGSTSPKCCCQPAVVMECQKKGGSATLVGRAQFSPFTTTPPQYFRSGTLSGTAKYYPTIDCSAIPVIDATASGSWHIDDSGNFDQVGQISTSNNGNPPNVKPTTQLAGVALGGWGTSCPAFATSATAAYLVFRPGPDNYPGYGPGADGYCPATNDTGVTSWLDMGAYPMSSTGSMTESMGNKDTEKAAETRAAPVWSEWGCGGAAGCCMAFRTQRTARTFSFQAARYRLGVPGGIVGNSYPVAVDFTRKPIGSTLPAVLAATEIKYVTASPETDKASWPVFDVPQLAGYETTAGNARVYVSG